MGLSERLKPGLERGRRLPVAVACGISLLALGCASIPAPQHVSGPAQRLVLTLTEIPYPGFEVEAGSSHAGYYSNRRVAGKDSALLQGLDRAGRQSGYERDFSRAVSPVQVVGPVVIESSASLYSTSKGAGKGLALLGGQLHAQGATPISTGQLGEQALGYAALKQLNGTSYASYTVLWRQANVVAAIQIEGNAATLDIQYALTLAKTQEGLLNHA